MSVLNEELFNIIELKWRKTGIDTNGSAEVEDEPLAVPELKTEPIAVRDREEFTTEQDIQFLDIGNKHGTSTVYQTISCLTILLTYTLEDCGKLEQGRQRLRNIS